MPIGKSKPVWELSKTLTLIAGPPKSGKTTLAASFPNCAFIATEAGLGHVEATRWETPDGRYVVQSWEELLSATAEVLAAKPATIVIDTIGNACLLCDQYVCKKHGEEYKGDGKLGYGKGTALIIGELRRYFTKLSATGVGLVMIAHTTQRTITTRTGPIEKTVPFFPGDNKAAELYNAVLGMADLVLYCTQESDRRVIRTKPHPTYDAGDRTGRLPDPLPMSFAALAAAFSNTAPVGATP